MRLLSALVSVFIIDLAGLSAAGPLTAQYLLFHGVDADQEKVMLGIDSAFPGDADRSIHIGAAISFLTLAKDSSLMRMRLDNLLLLSQTRKVPVFICLDVEQWLKGRPDLWNWFDTTATGYDPANRANVEWSGWNAADAIKVSWRNWGSQIRVLPAINLMSPAYREAARGVYARFLPRIGKWYDALPAADKYLFVGIKVGWESGIGLNAAYHINGNQYVETWSDDPSHDPPWPKAPLSHPPAYGFQQIGYAALKTSGIKTAGAITEADLAEVTGRHLLDLAKTALAAGIPREKLWTHIIPWSSAGLNSKAAANPYSNPGWSYYGSDPNGIRKVNPGVDSAIKNALGNTATSWGMVEAWLFAADYASWREFFLKTLAGDKSCRLVSLYNWNTAAESPYITKAALDVVGASPVSVSPPRPSAAAGRKRPRLSRWGGRMRVQTENPPGLGRPAEGYRLPDAKRVP